MSDSKVLLIGATGYIGGTVLHQILASAHARLRKSTVSVLVRGSERAAKLSAVYGDRITCILFSDLADTEFLSEISSQHDIVINAGTGFHPPSAEAMVHGLGKRTKTTGKATWMIHTSGDSNISDRPLTGTAYPDREWDDADAEKVYDFEKAENAREWYPQRAAELTVLDVSMKLGVNALSIQAPAIFGPGEGLFQNAGLVIPIHMRYVLEKGHGFVLGDGSGVIDYVHVSDLAALYVLLLINIIDDGGKNLPTGKSGIIFSTVGRVTIKDISQGCLDAAFATGALPRKDGPQEKELRTVDLGEAATTTAGNVIVAEVGWAGHRKQNGTVARRLGWRPTKGKDAWEKDFVDELSAALEGKRGETIGNAIAA